jgi:hypothetical protein
VRAAHHLNKFLTEFVADEDRYASAAAAAGSRRRCSPRCGRSPAPCRRSDLFEFGIASWIRALEPLARFPVLVELADDLAEDDPDGIWYEASADSKTLWLATPRKPHVGCTSLS